MKKLLAILPLLGFYSAIFSQSIASPLEKTLRSVVTIALYELEESDAVFGFGEEDRAAEIAYREALDLSSATSSGSGFVIEYSGKLYIVTNAHVVEGAANNPEAIRVFDIGRRQYEVELVGGDSFYDLAVLAFKEAVSVEDFPPIYFAKNAARLTEKVYAIGNPLGKYPYSITDGIVSGKNRVFQNPTTGRYGFLQHTATLIWGNSGGPLVNEKGEVVGVNAWIGTDVKDTQQFIFSQLNFAIESELAQRLIKEIIENEGRVKRPFLGIEFATRTDYLGLDSPPFIQNIIKESPASESLKNKIGHYVTEINGEKIKTLQDILRIIEQVSPDSNVDLFLEEKAPDFSNQGSMAGFRTGEKVSVKASDLSVLNLEKIACHFFENYADYELKTAQKKVHLSKKESKPKPRVEKMTVENQTAKYKVVTGEMQYSVIAAGLFDKWGRATLYRTQTLKDIGAVIRLCSLEGHLSTSVSSEAAGIENIRFFLQDADFNELRVLYY